MPSVLKITDDTVFVQNPDVKPDEQGKSNRHPAQAGEFYTVFIVDDRQDYNGHWKVKSTNPLNNEEGELITTWYVSRKHVEEYSLVLAN
jgi:hypothetical protein